MVNERIGRKKRCLTLAACVGSLGLVAIVSLGIRGSSRVVAATASSSTTTLPPCPPSLPPGATCDPQAIAAARASAESQNQKSWPAQSSTYLSESEAIASGRRWSPGSSGAAAHGRRMTYAQAAALIGESPNPSVAPDTTVWVVTVDASPGSGWYRPIPGQAPPSSYTVIMDAANGRAIDLCSPCVGQVTKG